MSNRAKKHFGQNFLINTNIIDRIINTANIAEGETVLEIGPGKGALTDALLKRHARVIAIEKDADLIPILKDNCSQEDLTILHADILSVDFKKIHSLDKIIGNIPYNISSPIVEKLIYSREVCPEIFLTVQKEFAKRLIAKPSTRDYGALSIFAQYYADIKILFDISPHAFQPVPKVTSAFMKMTFRPPAIKAADENLLFKISRTAFLQRRKKIFNSLETIIPKKNLEDILAENRYSEGARADHLSPHDFVTIANAWTKQLKKNL